jgi:RecA-family ATPase
LEREKSSSSTREKEIAAIDRELEELESLPAQEAWERLKSNKRKKAVYDNLDMITMDVAPEKDPHWLITDYMPRYQITSLAGDGGSGKTTVWCAIAAAISNGKQCFMLDGKIPANFAKCDPEKVMFFSAEDSFEYTLKRRLRKNGANLKNIFSIDVADERFPEIKFNSPFLESLLDKYRPGLVIFDPIQAFVPPDIRMGDRNAMRACLSPLIGYGEKYGTTFLIIEHANKQSGVWGRKRIADSADIWDISRSVIMAGETNEPGIRYLSHEKSNYGMTGNTILYGIDDEVIRFHGYSVKKDKDFVTEIDYSTRQAPQRDDAKQFILDFLKDGEKEVSELDDLAQVMSISKNTLGRAKSDLRNEGKIKSWSRGFNPKKWYIALTDTEKMG